VPDTVFLVNEAGGLQWMESQQYETEDLLQGLLESYPELMAGDEIDPINPRKWLLVSREIGVPDEEGGNNRWSLDHLFLDQDGVPTLVEVKRSTDTRIRREVVGQMLDYAANAVVYWPVEDLRNRFEDTCELAGKESSGTLQQFLMLYSEKDNSAAESSFWQLVKTNLQAGRIRLVFLADQIPPQLARIVEFLNEQMDPAQVIAVELKQFVGEGVCTLVPRVLGQTATAQQKNIGIRWQACVLVTGCWAYSTWMLKRKVTWL